MQIEGKRRSVWARALAYFFATILLLTLVSRAADAILLPLVECSRPLPGALNHVVSASGVIEAEEQRPVAAEPGLSIARVHVRAGQRVEAGEVLIAYDGESLRRALEEKQAALDALALQAQLDALDSGGSAPSEGAAQTGASGDAALQRQVIEQKLRALEIDAAQAEVDRLTRLLYDGATLTAPTAGTVSEVLVAAGDIATSEAALRLAPATSALVVRAQVTAEQAEHLSPGMEARFRLSGTASEAEARATLRTLAPTPSGFEAVFELPEGDGEVGQSVSLTTAQMTETYDMCVPLGAIVYRGEATGVYRIRTGQSVLGEVEYAEFVAVTVRETDAQTAAIEGSLLAQDSVIVSANKPVNEGDRVRSAA